MINDKMNKHFEHFYNIANRKVREFASAHKTSANDFESDNHCISYKTVVRLKGYEVHFIIGEGLSDGYRFLEGSEDSSELCLLTKFKFNFSDFYFSPYDIHNALELNDFRTLDFHKLLDDSMINNAFSAIFDFINQNNLNIERFGTDLTLQNKLVECYKFDMSIVSKRITDEKLNDDFKRYSEKHETNMYFYIMGADAMLGFISTGKRKPLEDYFIRKSRKNKLITYEKRFYDYLVLHDFSLPQNAQINFTKKIKTDETHGTIIRTLSVIISLVFVFAYDLITFKIAETTAFKDYNIIYSYDSSSFIWIFGAAAFAGIISIVVKRLFFKHTTAKSIVETNNKTANTVLIAICIVLSIAFCILQYYSNQNLIALGEKDIVINRSLSDRETLSYDSDNIDFCLIEGGYDENGNYTDDTQYKELLIILYDNYYGYICSDVHDQELLKTVSELESHNVKIESYKNLAQYEEMHDIE